jgi:hypothetical protein
VLEGTTGRNESMRSSMKLYLVKLHGIIEVRSLRRESNENEY